MNLGPDLFSTDKRWSQALTLMISILISLSVLVVGGVGGASGGSAGSPPVQHDGALLLSDANADQQLGSSADLVYATNHSTLVAYNDSGEKVWSADLGDDTSADPATDGDLVAVAVKNDLRVYNASDGTLRWNSNSTTGLTVDSASVVLGEYVYVSNNKFSSNNGTTVYAYHPENGSVAWYNEIGGDPISLGGDDKTLLVEQDDTVLRLNTSTGEVVWDRSDFPLAGSAEAPPVVINDSVYAVSENNISSFDRTTGVPEWQTPVNDDISAAPAAGNGSVYVASGQTVHALDPETGSEHARFRTNGTVEALTYRPGTLYVASDDGNLYAFNGSLDRHWTYDIPRVTEDPDDDAWAYALTSTNDSVAAMVATDEYLGDGQPAYHSLSLFRPTNASVTDVQVSAQSVAPGDTVTATATVSNNGTGSAEVDVTVEVDGPFTPLAADRFVETVTVPGETTADVTTDFQVNTTGEYTVTAYESGTDELARDVRPGSVTVTAEHAQPDHDWRQSGFDASGSSSNPLTNAPPGPLEAVWEYQPNDDYGDHPPLVENGTVFVHNETHVKALDIETSAEEWEFVPQTPYENDQDSVKIGSHAAVDGTVYFTMTYRNNTDDTSRVYALDSQSSAGEWGGSEPYVEFEDRKMNDDVFAVDSGTVFFEVSGKRSIEWNLTAIDSTTGTVESIYGQSDGSSTTVRTSGSYVVQEVNSTLRTLDSSLAPVSSRDFGTDDVQFAAVDDTVYVATAPSTTDNGTVYALNASDLSEQRWMADPKGTDANPYKHDAIAVSEELVITITDNRVFAFDRDTGAVVWTDDTWGGNNEFFDVTTADGVLYVAGDGPVDSSVVYDARTGERISAFFGKSRHLTVSNDTVLQGGIDSVRAYRPSGPPTIDDVALSDSSPALDDTIWLNATVTNPYDHTMADLSAALFEGSSETNLDGADFTLAPGETKRVNLSTVVDRYEDWNYRIEVKNDGLENDPHDIIDEAVSERRSVTVAQYDPIESVPLDGVVAVDPRLQADQVWTGETVNLTVDLVNLGSSSANRTLVASSAGFALDDVTETVTVSAGATRTVNLSLGDDSTAMDVSVLLNGTQVGTLDIVDDTVDLYDWGVLDNPVSLGAEGPFEVEFDNTGNLDNVTTVAVAVDGQTVQTASRTFTAGERTSFNVSHTFDTPGDRSLRVEFVNGTDVTAQFNRTVTVDREVWTFSTGAGVDSSPTIVGGIAYVGSDDGNVYAIDAANGTEAWQFPTGGKVRSSPTVVNDRLYVGSEDANVYALNTTDGSEVWNTTTGDWVQSSPTVANGTVYVGNEAGNVYAFDAATGTEEWNFTTGGNVRSSPTVLDGTLYVGSYDGSLYALDAENGTAVWTRDLDDSIFASPTVVNGSVYIRSYSFSPSNATLYALDAATGADEQLDSKAVGYGSDASPTVADGIVYDGRYNGLVYATDAENGTEVWQSDLGVSDNFIYSSPTVADGTLYVGSYDGRLYALDSTNGSLAWSHPIGSDIYSSPTVVNGTVYVGSDDGNVYALGTGEAGSSRDSRVLSGTLGHHKLSRPDALLAVFTHEPDQPGVNDAVTFDADYSNTAGSDTVTYQWDFDGDGTVDETTQSPVTTYSFGAPGDYDATLTVENGTGTTDETTRTVTVVGQAVSFAVTVVGTNDPVTPGEPFEADVEVENNGGQGTQSVELLVNSTPEDTAEQSLMSAESTVVTLKLSTDGIPAGDYPFTVQSESDTATGTLTIAEPAPAPTPTPPDDGNGDDDFGGDNSDGNSGSDDTDNSDGNSGSDDAETTPTEPTVSIQTATLSSTTVATNDTVVANVTLATDGDQPTNHSLTLRVDGDPVRTQTVSVPADGTRPLVLTHTFESPGEYTLAIGNQSVGAVTVTGQQTASPTRTTDQTQPPTREETGTETDASAGPVTTSVPTPSATTAGSPTASLSERTTGAGSPGFGLVAAVLAVLAVTLLARRRQ